MSNIVTTERIKSAIDYIEYFDAGKTTICVVTLTNGYQVVSTSACVDKETYNLNKGKSIALEKAIKKIEDLETHRLQWETAGDIK